MSYFIYYALFSAWVILAWDAVRGVKYSHWEAILTLVTGWFMLPCALLVRLGSKVYAWWKKE